MQITKLYKILFPVIAGLWAVSAPLSCKKDDVISPYKTKNVIILVVDGARYTETWGDPKHLYIPNQHLLMTAGIANTNMYNNGATNTSNGHAALTTGVYQNIDNGGNEYPGNPSIFQYWLHQKSQPATAAWVITSKDKLEVLANCKDTLWKDQYKPMTNCGINGLFTGYRHDSTTIKNVFSILTEHHPRLVLINFKEPDASGHAGNWNNYLQGIVDTDKYIGQLWTFLQSDNFYKNSTTLFITSDHGRHYDGHLDGFISHGDGCYGCRHISLMAAGPDFKKGATDATMHSLVDVCATAAELLGVYMPTSTGKVMYSLFSEPRAK